MVVAMTTWINTRQIGRIVKDIRPIGFLSTLLVPPVLLVLCVGMIRSTLDHRPVYRSTAALSTDPLVNDLALNST